MKKRVLSLLLAVITVFSVFGMTSTAFAAGSKQVFSHYSKKGKYKVSSFEFTLPASNDFTYKVWYPKNIKKLSKRPVILYCNGTGSNYTMDNETSSVLTKAASYGYVCLCNTDKNTGTGASMDAGMTKLIAYNSDRGSKLYNKLDLTRVGIAGHSQGATCTMNLSDPAQYTNSKYYKAIFAASLPTNALAASSLQNCPYDSAKVTIPTCLVAGTGFTDSKFICPIKTSLNPNFANIKSDVYMARMKDVEHAGSFEAMHPYMLAWFDYQFYGKAFAAKAFTGKKPELKANPEWQDFRYKLTPKTATIKRAKGAGKSLKVSWKKQNTASGYKIEYSTNSSFKGKKVVTVKGAKNTSVKIKKLKGAKTYYVRVRSYIKVGKKNNYSSYSEVMTAKVKK